MVNAMLSNLGLGHGFWGEALLTTCYVLNRVPNKKSKTTPYEFWNKRKPNLSHLKVWGCRTIVRVPEPKIKKLGERGIECIFIGYALRSKAYRFMVIEPNDFISVNTILESTDALFDETRFSSIPRLRDVVSQVPEMEHNDSQVQDQQEVDSNDALELRKSKRERKTKNYGLDFLVYLVEGFSDSISNCVPYCFNVESDPITYEEAMSSSDASFWKEEIDDEMTSIMGNDTWKLVNLPLGCKLIRCKWVFKTKKNLHVKNLVN